MAEVYPAIFLVIGAALALRGLVYWEGRRPPKH